MHFITKWKYNTHLFNIQAIPVFCVYLLGHWLLSAEIEQDSNVIMFWWNWSLKWKCINWNGNGTFKTSFTENKAVVDSRLRLQSCWHQGCKWKNSRKLATSCQPGLPSSKDACTKYLRVIGQQDGSIPKRPMNQNGPREGQKRPIARSKTAHSYIQNGPLVCQKRPIDKN